MQKNCKKLQNGKKWPRNNKLIFWSEKSQQRLRWCWHEKKKLLQDKFIKTIGLVDSQLFRKSLCREWFGIRCCLFRFAKNQLFYFLQTGAWRGVPLFTPINHSCLLMLNFLSCFLVIKLAWHYTDLLFLLLLDSQASCKSLHKLFLNILLCHVHRSLVWVGACTAVFTSMLQPLPGISPTCSAHHYALIPCILNRQLVEWSVFEPTLNSNRVVLVT